MFCVGGAANKARHSLGNDFINEADYVSRRFNAFYGRAEEACGLTLREIGSMFGGLDYAAVGQRIRRIQKRAEADKKLKRTIEMLNV